MNQTKTKIGGYISLAFGLIILFLFVTPGRALISIEPGIDTIIILLSMVLTFMGSIIATAATLSQKKNFMRQRSEVEYNTSYLPKKKLKRISLLNSKIGVNKRGTRINYSNIKIPKSSVENPQITVIGKITAKNKSNDETWNNAESSGSQVDPNRLMDDDSFMSNEIGWS